MPVLTMIEGCDVPASTLRLVALTGERFVHSMRGTALPDDRVRGEPERLVASILAGECSVEDVEDLTLQALVEMVQASLRSMAMSLTRALLYQFTVDVTEDLTSDEDVLLAGQLVFECAPYRPALTRTLASLLCDIWVRASVREGGCGSAWVVAFARAIMGADGGGGGGADGADDVVGTVRAIAQASGASVRMPPGLRALLHVLTHVGEVTDDAAATWLARCTQDAAVMRSQWRGDVFAAFATLVDSGVCNAGWRVLALCGRVPPTPRDRIGAAMSRLRGDGGPHPTVLAAAGESRMVVIASIDLNAAAGNVEGWSSEAACGFRLGARMNEGRVSILLQQVADEAEQGIPSTGLQPGSHDAGVVALLCSWSTLAEVMVHSSGWCSGLAGLPAVGLSGRGVYVMVPARRTDTIAKFKHAHLNLRETDGPRKRYIVAACIKTSAVECWE